MHCFFYFVTFDFCFFFPSFSASCSCICQIFCWKVWIALQRFSRKDGWDLLACQRNPRVPLLYYQHIDWFLYSCKSVTLLHHLASKVRSLCLGEVLCYRYPQWDPWPNITLQSEISLNKYDPKEKYWTMAYFEHISYNMDVLITKFTK